MLSLLYAGDTDILRDATDSSTVFWHRVRSSPGKVALVAVLTLVLLATIGLLWAGPEGSGLLWATRERSAMLFSAAVVIWAIGAGWAFFKVLPSRNDRVVIAMRNLVRASIDPLEEQVRALSDEQLRGKRVELSARLAAGATLDDVRAEAFACVREASRRARNHRHFECQLIGGQVIEQNKVAEMRTGEGKTIVCYAANFMKVLAGMKVHMVTVNDYLVRRDAEFCRPIFDLLGVTVGFITNEMESYGPAASLRRAAYHCDITYGTNSEFGFDYLRDNMKMDVNEQVQIGRQDFAVVDEVDSILIDEARTPLIISGAAHDDVTNYKRADGIARALIRRQEQSNREFAARADELEANPPPGMKSEPKFASGLKKFKADPLWLSSDEAEAIGHTQFFVVELDRKSAHMTEHGAKAAQAELGLGTFYDGRNMNWPHYIDQALRAHICYTRDKDYVVQDGTVVIVDEFTGRLMQGRQWSDGLHQAVEAKETVEIKKETQTLASITLQNLFKMYKNLSGMTGTAMTEADEFNKIYRLEVIAVPTNKAIRRIDYNDKLYKTGTNKFDAIVEEIRAYSQNGYPSDPWSLYDMLRDVRRPLQEMKKRGSSEIPVDEYLSDIDAAIKQFNEGRGDASALERTYLKLLGDKAGPRPLLVGTVSVEASEKLSQALTRAHGIDHEVLNAKNHAREAEIVAKAGQRHELVRGKRKGLVGNVTIATNMAGRGTDIVLGSAVAEHGGLHVVGTERHESRRIDNQLRGRCGRQGDPGSSRFFLSFEDDLLRLFMAEWVLRVLDRYVLEEGVPIEHKSLTRGIENAQKKVEERNFGIRKNLLEYDEVPDQQRREFYSMRQRIVEGRDLSEFIWDLLDQTVADAVDRYLDAEFPALCASEWAAQHLGVNVDHTKLDAKEYAVLADQVRDLAGSEVRSAVQRTFGEYIDRDIDPDDWDLRGFSNWIAQFGLNLTQRQIRDVDPEELLDDVITAAQQKVEKTDLSPLEAFTSRTFGRDRLIAWALDKFGVSIPAEELNVPAREDAVRVVRERMRAVYRRREVEYPVAAVIDYALQRAGSNVNSFYEQIARWCNLKFRLDWTYEVFLGKTPQQIFQELSTLNEEFLRHGRIEAEIDAAMQKHSGEELSAWARDRFGAVMSRMPLDGTNGDARGHLAKCAFEMFRFELTQLERMVLLTTIDSVWKDHMYAMDLLRSGIGLRGYAERDPKIEFKREGTRLFRELMSNIRERVSDLIFKVQVSTPLGTEGGAATERAPAPRLMTSKADATGAGFASAAAERQGQEKRPDEGSAEPTAPIRRDAPRVGRNDPCPCGSGKKYKSCHGKSA